MICHARHTRCLMPRKDHMIWRLSVVMILHVTQAKKKNKNEVSCAFSFHPGNPGVCKRGERENIRDMGCIFAAEGGKINNACALLILLSGGPTKYRRQADRQVRMCAVCAGNLIKVVRLSGFSFFFYFLVYACACVQKKKNLSVRVCVHERSGTNQPTWSTPFPFLMKTHPPSSFIFSFHFFLTFVSSLNDETTLHIALL